MIRFKNLTYKMTEPNTIYFATQNDVDSLKQRIKLDKLKSDYENKSDAVNILNRVLDVYQKTNENLHNNLKEQEDSINESYKTYQCGMQQGMTDAKQFCESKTLEELKYYLAKQPVAYNKWKDADFETCVKLVCEVYDYSEEY